MKSPLITQNSMTPAYVTKSVFEHQLIVEFCRKTDFPVEVPRVLDVQMVTGTTHYERKSASRRTLAQIKRIRVGQNGALS
ncbi:hypothetical protein RRG08_003527 [Elysia crispata]|uniref:Uncharacterized protein n=1 Tax=Elysia crispata TaxID=231223 RepID=A0AAE1CTG9_9GAST|nr:hypothetical protein RRG08_003527 [Elysia crispata]